MKNKICVALILCLIFTLTFGFSSAFAIPITAAGGNGGSDDGGLSAQIGNLDNNNYNINVLPFLNPTPQSEPSQPTAAATNDYTESIYVKKIELANLSEDLKKAVENNLDKSDLSLVSVVDVILDNGYRGMGRFEIAPKFFDGTDVKNIKTWKLNSDGTLKEVKFDVVNGIIVFNYGQAGMYMLAA